MGYTQRDYPVMLVGVSLEYGGTLESGHKRKRVGDIIDVRPPASGIGRLENSRYLWFLAEGLEENEWGKLVLPLYVGAEQELQENKRRFTVDLEKLAELYPWMDMDRLMDPADPYQPLMALDDDNETFLVDIPLQIVDVADVVWDRETLDYLNVDLLREVSVG